jgi:hypothetical protein
MASKQLQALRSGLPVVTAANDTASDTLLVGTYYYRLSTRGYSSEDLPSTAVTQLSRPPEDHPDSSPSRDQQPRAPRATARADPTRPSKFTGSTGVARGNFTWVDDNSAVAGAIKSEVDTPQAPPA